METNFQVYIKKANGDFYDDWAYAAYVGFKNRGFLLEQTLFFYEEIREVPAKRTNIVIGPIEDTIEFFKRVKIDIPLPLNIPECLRKDQFLKRAIDIWDLKYIRDNSNYDFFPMFLKSNKEIKLFTSGPVKNRSDFNIVTNGVSDDVEVLVSDIIEFQSEYRCFVNHGKWVGMKHYLGDFQYFPNTTFIQKCIDTYSKTAPVSYTIDFGVDSLGETYLIECNDAWSIGHYGLDEKIYVKLLVDRWMQIMFNYTNH